MTVISKGSSNCVQRLEGDSEEPRIFGGRSHFRFVENVDSAFERLPTSRNQYLTMMIEATYIKSVLSNRKQNENIYNMDLEMLKRKDSKND